MPSSKTTDVLDEIEIERFLQDKKWGEQNHPHGTGDDFSKREVHVARQRYENAFALGNGTWRHVLDEEVQEAFAEDDPVLLREELIQVAAVAVAWIEAIDRANN